MSNFVNEFKANTTRTENGALVKSTTGSSLLNLFARIGGLRNQPESEIIRLYHSARIENPELADNLILYARDIRNGGIGERRIARILLNELVKFDKDKVKRNFDTIVECGRWDDLFSFVGTPLEKDAFAYIQAQFKEDIVNYKNNKNISLLAKWMPSINTSSADTRRLAKKFCNYASLSEKSYRKALSKLRQYLNVVEKKMSANQFDAIDYEKVPSQAMTKYRSAFGRHDFERFNDYITAVTSGNAKINSSVSYPYELIRPYTHSRGYSYIDKVLEEQWKALPNYVEGNHNVIVMSDVSGSMTGAPMDTSVSLGIYFAERNKGAYHGLVMSFTDYPSLFDISDFSTLYDKAKEVTKHCGYSTNLDLAFKNIYDIAVKTREVPDALVVISDGEIDRYASSASSIVEKWKREYEKASLTAPKLIMWNVASRGDRYIANKDENVSFISGQSASSFKELTNLIENDAYTAMVNILSKFTWK